MEFTVSKADLVRELSLSQGVVEKKTTIPILSNVLLEAAGDRVTLTATDLELGIRCSCPARVKKEGAGTVPARKLLDYVRLLPEGDVNMKFLENHWASITAGRSRTRIAGMSRESFPELPQMPRAYRGDPGEDAGVDDRADGLCDFDGRIAVHAERSAPADAAGGVDHGGDRRPPPGVRAGDRRTERNGRPAVSRAGSEEGHGGTDQTGGRGRAGRQGDFRGRRQSPVLPGGPPAADHAQADRQFPGLRARSAEGSFAHRPSCRRTRSARPSSVWRSSPTSGRGRSACSSPTAKCGCFPPPWRWARAKRAVTSEYQGPDLEIGFNAQYLLDFLRAIPQEQRVVRAQRSKERGRDAAGGRRNLGSVSLRSDADADLRRDRNKELWQTM